MSIAALLIVIAAILFLLASIGWPASRIGLGWLGLFFLAISQLVGVGTIR